MRERNSKYGCKTTEALQTRATALFLFLTHKERPSSQTMGRRFSVRSSGNSSQRKATDASLRRICLKTGNQKPMAVNRHRAVPYPTGHTPLLSTHCPDEALRLVDPIIDIEVHADAHIAFMTIEDHRIYSPVRVKKTDAETGKTVLSPGTVRRAAQARCNNGEYQPVSFDVHTPSTEHISRFTIPESGMAQFPKRLAWGSYAIREVFNHRALPHAKRARETS